MMTRREVAVVALAMLALSIAATWPLARDAKGALPGDLGDPLFGTFVLAWDASRIAHGLHGLWDAPLYFPMPDTLALAEHLLGIAIFTAPVQWLTGHPVLTYNIAFLASYVLAGVGMYVLALVLWRRRDAAVLAALAFAFAPHRAAQMSHLQVLMSGWMPVCLWGLHRYVETRSRRALAVCAGAFMLLGLSNGYYLYLFGLPLVLVAGVEAGSRVWREGDGRAWLLRRYAVDMSAAIIAVGAVFAPVAVAYLRARAGLGLHRPLGELRGYSAALGDYLRVSPDLRIWAGRLESGSAERSLFPGAIVLCLAAAGIAAAILRRGRRADHDGKGADARTVWLYAAVAGLAAWLALGPFFPGPYRLLLDVIPGFSGLRVPARFGVVVALALAVVAGGGAAWVLRRLGRNAALAATTLIAAAMVLEGSAAPIRMEPFDVSQPGRRDVNEWLRIGPPGGVLELPIAEDGATRFTLPYQFNTLIHGHPIVNGYSGYNSALQSLLGGAGSPLKGDPGEVAAAVSGLRTLGVRYVILHDVLFARWGGMDQDRLVGALAGLGGQVAGQRHQRGIWAWQLADAPPVQTLSDARLEPIPVTALSASASLAPGDLRFAFDGSLATHWSTGQPQAGGEWVRLAFAQPRDIAAIDVEMGSLHTGAYPRGLTIEAEAPDGIRQRLFEGSVVTRLVEAIGRDSRTSRIRIELPSGQSRALWLRQTGKTDAVPWSIAELRLWSRR